MKKLTYCLVIVLIMALFSNIVLADNASFGIGLTATKTSVNPGDEIIVTAKVKDFKNMTEGIYSFLATIGYDSQVFETLTETSVKGLGTWSSVPTFNPGNGLITADSGSGVKQESDVFSITFKVKADAKTGESTQITLKDFEASEGEYDISADAPATLTISVVEKVADDNTGDNNTEDDNNNDNSGDNNTGDNDNNDNSGDNNTGDNNNNDNSGDNNTGDNNNNDNSGDNNTEDNNNNDNTGDNNTEDNNNNDNNEDENTGNDNNNSGNNNNNQGNNNNNNSGNNNSGTKEDTTTSKDEKLPQTGEGTWVIISLIGVITAVGIIAYRSYKKYYNI